MGLTECSVLGWSRAFTGWRRGRCYAGPGFKTLGPWIVCNRWVGLGWVP